MIYNDIMRERYIYIHIYICTHIHTDITNQGSFAMVHSRVFSLSAFCLTRLMDGEYFTETEAGNPEPAIAAVTRGLRRGCAEHGIIVNLVLVTRSIGFYFQQIWGCQYQSTPPTPILNTTNKGTQNE